MIQDNRLSPLTREIARPTIDAVQPAAAAWDAHAGTEKMEMRDHLAIVLKRRWLIISIVVAVTSLVSLYMYHLPSVYEAETTIRIEHRNESFLRARDIVINTAADPIHWQTQLKLLENPQLIRQLVLTLDLQNNPSFLSAQSKPGLLASLRRIFSKAPAKQAEPIAPVPSDVEELTAEQRARLAPYVNAILSSLTVEPVAGTNLVKIRFAHTSPEIAMKVTDTLAELFIANETRQETLGTQNATVQLARQLTDLQLTIKQQEEERLNFIRNHELPTGDTRGQNLTADRLAMLSSQLLAAENDRKNLQAAYETAARAPDVWSIPEVQADRNVQDLRAQIRELEKRRAAMLVKYTPDWPDVQELEEQIKQLKQNLDRAPREIVAAMKSRYDSAQSRERELRASYFQELGTANQQSQAGIEMSSLSQQIETNKQLYNTLLQRQKELEISSSDQTPNVTVATPSEMPTAPVGPPRATNIFISFLLSLGAGCGLAFMLQKLDDTLKSADEIANYTRLPMLSVIPAARRAFPLKGRELMENTALALIEDARSPVSEGYRHLRTSLLFSSNLQPPRTLLVTSGQPLEGKTTTAVNTAVIFAQTGADVLLIDCDLRRPRVHTHFNFSNERGLSDILAGEVKADEAAHIYEKHPNLKVITAGRVPSNPAEILGSDEMRQFVNRMSERFTHVIIDSPPAISFTDASILSTLVDGVILVVRGGRSSRAAVLRVKQRLASIGAHIYGIILNDARTETQDYYYDSYYSHYYPAGESAAARVSVKRSVRTDTTTVSISTSQIEQAFEKFEREL